jgi:hypothetical protein
LMGLSPEQRLVAVRRGLVVLYNAREPCASTDLFDESFGEASRRRILKKLLEGHYVEKLGAGTQVRYSARVDAVEQLTELIESPEKLSAFIWPRFEGHLGSTPAIADSVTELEDSSEEESEEEPEEEPRGVLEGDAAIPLLRGIAEAIGGLTELVAALYTNSKEGGDARPSVDLAPFVRSYVGLREEMKVFNTRLANIEKGLGLREADEEDNRGSGRGLQNTTEQHGETEGNSRGRAVGS